MPFDFFFYVYLNFYFVHVTLESGRINYVFVKEEGRFQLKIMHVSLLIRRAKHMLAEKML